MDWLQKHWSNVVTIVCILIAAFIQAWQQAVSSVPSSVPVPRLEGLWHYAPLGLLIAAGLVWLLNRRKPVGQPQVQTTDSVPGIPTLSALLGQNPSVDFNAKKFFALAHYSPVTAEIEKNIRIIAEQNSPNDKEAFYARLIGVGTIAFQHDMTSLLIFGSQVKAMTELSSRGLMPVADLKKHYDKAVVEFPGTYKDYSFEQWLDFMKSRLLIAVYPSQMVEISFAGQDFLKYVSHFGRNVIDKPN